MRFPGASFSSHSSMTVLWVSRSRAARWPIGWMRVSLTLALLMSTAIETHMGRRRGVLRAGKLAKNTFSRAIVFHPLPRRWCGSRGRELLVSWPIGWMWVSLTLALLMSTAIETDLRRRKGVLRARKPPQEASSPGHRIPPTSMTVVRVSSSRAASWPVERCGSP